MKKRLIVLLVLIDTMLLLACIYNTYHKNRCQITFQYEDGKIHEIVEIKKGKPLPYITEPTQRNHIFIGWFTDPINGEKMDLSKGVTKNLTLYARFQLEAATLTNTITSHVMKSIVKIECRAYNPEAEFYDAGWRQGSGFCYAAGNDYYYILTNCHAVCKNSEDDRLDIRIYDYKGNRYKGYLYHDPNKQGDAISPDYDLACIYFTAESSEVTPLPIVKNNPAAGSAAIALGAPQSQMNSITFGKVINYQAIDLHNTPAYKSNVTFPVLCHSAETSGGSSGGPILNNDLNVVGVHYAGNIGSPFGYAIPAEKIHEFLEKYVK